MNQSVQTPWTKKKKRNMIQESHINMSSESVLNVKRRHDMDIDSQEPTVGLLLLRKGIPSEWFNCWKNSQASETRCDLKIENTLGVARTSQKQYQCRACVLPIHSQHGERGRAPDSWNPSSNGIKSKTDNVPLRRSSTQMLGVNIYNKYNYVTTRL